MTENTGSTRSGADDELEDPGRDPKGLDPPRNLFGAGPDQDSGRGAPEGSPGIAGQSMMPEAPTDDDRAGAGGTDGDRAGGDGADDGR